MHTLRRLPRFFQAVVPLAMVLLLPPAAAWCAQLHPAEISATQSQSLPYRLTGQLNVTFGTKQYFGTGTYIRRYTGLTAGHLLYDPKGGFGTSLYLALDMFEGESAHNLGVGYFAVLSGYQSAANNDPDSNPAFDYDMGYLLFNNPEPNAEWADFAAIPTALTTDTSFLVFGYAAENFSGDTPAYVNIASSFYLLLAPGLYENNTYYTEEGMSGGPLYVTTAGVMQIAGVTVAGTDPPDSPLSDVRVITSAEQTLFTEAEYAHGYITSGTIKGPTSVAAGTTAKFKTGVVFKDGVQERRDLPVRYAEVYLKAVGPNKHLATVTRIKTGKFKVDFSSDLPSGSVITLHLLRDTVSKSTQTPLQELQVTVQ